MGLEVEASVDRAPVVQHNHGKAMLHPALDPGQLAAELMPHQLQADNTQYNSTECVVFKTNAVDIFLY